MNSVTRDTRREAQLAKPHHRHQAAPSYESIDAAIPCAGVGRDTGVSQRNHTPLNLLAPPQSVLRSLVASETPEQRARRKRKLFCLFQSHDTAQLDSLAQQARAPTLTQMINPQKRPATLSTKSGNKPSDLPTAVALFSHPSTRNPRKPGRSSYRAKTLQELEAETLSFHLPGANHNRHHAPPDLKPFSLRFQECSILAIARYTSRRANAPQRSIPNYPPRACVDVNFRRCGICRKWGHYESECSHVQQLEAYRALPYDQRIKQTTRTNASVTAAAVPKDVLEADVCVEPCDGFMIEQRAVRRNEASIEKKAQQTNIENVESVLGGFKIKASSTSFAGPNTTISVGDLVAWNTTDESMATGIVETVDHREDTVIVRCIASSFSAGTVPESFKEPPETLRGVQTTLPIMSVKRVKRAQSPELRKPLPHAVTAAARKRIRREVNDDGTRPCVKEPVFEDGFFRKPRGRDPKGMEWDAVRGLWRPIQERRHTNDDGTLSSKKSPALANGVYRKPRGRDPKGMEWDEIRGLWKPRNPLGGSIGNGGGGYRESPFYYS